MSTAAWDDKEIDRLASHWYPCQDVDPDQEMVWTFTPRPDQVHRYDQQTSFYNSKHTGITFLLGGNGAGTTTLALAKILKFCLQEQEAPRKDTPIWIVSESYDMVCDVCWNEKMCNRGMLPREEVDWDRVDWYKPNRNWAFGVPLRPWKNGNGKTNWLLEFKSYKQGRKMMQAASVGGFCFVEQAPWDILIEVYARSRDYSFPGSKIAEFTPIDPVLSAPLEEMLANGTLPKNWDVYYCNTECALEAGHVTQEWFEQFFGMLSPQERETRMRGAFASFEGAIYPQLNPAIHFVDGLAESIDHDHCIHKRAIDWGSSQDHAMVCLWAAIRQNGQVCVYDEYYSNDQNLTYLDHAQMIRSQQPWDDGGVMYRETYADPASPGLARIFATQGIYCSPANNNVLEGIDAVRALLSQTLPDGSPAVVFDSRLTNTKREMTGYRWEQRNKAAGILNPKDAAPKPLKKDDHCPDAFRYLYFTHLLGSRTGGLTGRKIVPKNRKRFVSY